MLFGHTPAETGKSGNTTPTQNGFYPSKNIQDQKQIIFGKH